MTDLIHFSFLALLRTLDCDVVLMLGLIPRMALMIRTSDSDVVDYRPPHLTRAYDLRRSRSYVDYQASLPLD